MIIIFYKVMIAITAIIMVIAYVNNSRVPKRNVVTVIRPNYKTCIITEAKIFRGRALSVRTYPLNKCTPTHEVCGCIRRTQDFDGAIRS